jgi:hypothetical protein
MFSSLITLYQFVVSESYSSLSMTAFMGNSGALSSYLAMLFPWLLVFYSNSKKKLKYTYVLTIFLTIFIIILTQGRASWVAVFFSTLFIVSIKNSFLPRRLAVFRKSKKTKLVSLLAFSLFLIILGLVVFNLKKDSANGRLFIWKRTIEIIKEEPLIGIGYGKFSSLYPICQANYLKENKTDTARFLANDINHPFNEYLHITTELGLVGLLFFLGIFISIFLYKPKLNKINLACSGSIISFLILSLFTYPFKIFSIQFLLFLFLVIFSSNTNKKVFSLKKKHIMILFVPIVLLVFWIVDSEITRSSNERELKKILNVTDGIVRDFVTAKVVGISDTPFASSATLQCGSKNNIKVNDIVRGSSGLIGRISEVSENYSIAVLINDHNSRIPVLTGKSKAKGIIAKQGDNLKMIYLEENHDILVGETVYTSGDGKIFPKGIPVATIVKIVGRTIYVKAIEQFNKIEYVVIESNS